MFYTFEFIEFELFYEKVLLLFLFLEEEIEYREVKEFV